MSEGEMKINFHFDRAINHINYEFSFINIQKLYLYFHSYSFCNKIQEK